MGKARRQRVPLEAVACGEEPWSLFDRASPTPRRCDPRQRLLRQVEPVGDEPDRFLPLGRVLRPGEDLAHTEPRLLPVTGTLDLDPDAVVQVALGARETVLERLRCIRGVLPRRQRHDAYVEPLPHRELHAAQRRILAGSVGVEAQEHATAESVELAQVPFGEGGSHRSDNRLEARLAQRDHVGVPLDHDRALLLRDRGACEVEAVEHVRLLEQLALGRVHVLPPERVVVAETACLEADHTTPSVCEREHEPEREVVVATLVGQPRRAQLVCGEAPRSRLRRQPSTGREPEPELLRDLLTEIAAREVLAHGPAGLGVPQVPLEEHRRLLEGLVEPVTMVLGAFRRGRGLLVLELNPEPVGQPFDRADEVEALRLAHEGDHVALGAAPEAEVVLVDGVHREARRALLVERAAARVAGSCLAQRGALGDDLHHVRRCAHVHDRCVLDARHQIEPAYASANRSVMPAT